ncbi:MAG: heavy metal-binding domain-containing protein [Lachnospiraceae bacterium]|nr:heavy metal-binding domain-containing protein [Lachnospiraceae bacterium]
MIISAKEAESLGADAVVGARFSSASVMQGAAEIMTYGTAIRFV